ncbi:MAG: putative anti-sigma-YlaC factor YlaD [Planctomycetota bacterium]|jgi:predicted anti-sigma-YlaC factor YlaD
MKCDRVEKLFSDVYEGVLNPERSNQVREHIEGCNQCSSAYYDFDEAFCLAVHE